MRCKYNDCGWCYAPANLPTMSVQGACDNPNECEAREEITEEKEKDPP